MALSNGSNPGPGRVSLGDALRGATQHLVQGRFDVAKDILGRILQAMPGHAHAMHLLAVAHFNTGDPARAIELLHRSIEISPGDPAAHHHLAFMLSNQGRLEESVAAARRAVELDPACLPAKSLLAQGLAALKRHQEAVVLFEELTRAQPQEPLYWDRLGISLIELERFDAAAELYERTLATWPNDAGMWNNLGCAYNKLYKVQLSAEAYRKAAKLAPANVGILVNYALALVDIGDIAGALVEHDRAVELAPDDGPAHTQRACQNLRAGKFKEGFAEFDWRWKMPTAKNPWARLPGPLWDGKDPRGKRLLIFWEEGLGDVIMFSRFVPILADMGATVILVVQPDLTRLMACLPGVSHLVRQSPQTDAQGNFTGHVGRIPPYDAYLPLLSLPRVLGTEVGAIPDRVPYLSPPADEAERWRQRLADDRNLRVGLVWATSSKTCDNRRRFIPPAALRDLLAVPDVTFYGMAVGAPAKDVAAITPRFIDVSTELHDFATTAAVVAQMDLVISIDTSVTHLAGAMAKPLWVLLAWCFDWRWSLSRDRSPWYPTARLFHQSVAGDWTATLAEVRRELAAMKKGR